MVFDASEPSPGTLGEPVRELLGELLVQAKVITVAQLALALSAQSELLSEKKIGQLLIDRGWLTEAQLTQTLSLQLSVPWVSLSHIDFSRQLLNRVPRELADRGCLIPIFVRHVKGQGETLYVAMDDPTNESALQEVAQHASLPARPMIASATDIRSAIRVYYGEPPPPEVRLSSAPVRMPSYLPSGTPPRAVHASVSPSGRPLPPVAELDPMVDVGRSETESASRQSVAPRADSAEPRRVRAKALSLTLLDGTTISLPPKNSFPPKKKSIAPHEGISTRQLVDALRATARGNGSADPIESAGGASPVPQWEPVVAALLSILMRKGLIADWEFVEELRKG